MMLNNPHSVEGGRALERDILYNEYCKDISLNLILNNLHIRGGKIF